MNIDELCRDVLAATSKSITDGMLVELACRAAPALARECQRLQAAIAELRAENERLKAKIREWNDKSNRILDAVNDGIVERDRLQADRDRLLAALREQVRHCGECHGNGKIGTPVMDMAKYLWKECLTCKPARDLIAEHEAKK